MNIESMLEDLVHGVGLSITTLNVASDEPHMRQLVSLMNQTGQDIVRRAEWSRSYENQTIAANLTEFPLPNNYYKMAERGTIHLVGSALYEPVRLIAEPATWKFMQARPSGQTYAHIADGKLLFAPDSGPNGAAMTYVKSGWLTDGKDHVTSNAQIPVFPTGLLLSGVLWRWNRRAGLPYDDLAAEFEANFTAAVNADRGLT